MGRPRKTPAPEIDIRALTQVLLETYGVLIDQRDPTDFGGHDYAYKTGYATVGVKQALEMLGVELGGDE